MYCEEVSAVYSQERILSNSDAAKLLSREFYDADREYFMVLNLDASGRPISYHIVNVGTLSMVAFPIANAFKTAIIQNACSLILCHNHPGGQLQPSQEDIEATEEMVRVGKILGIKVVDHFILANNDYISLRSEMGYLFD